MRRLRMLVAASALAMIITPVCSTHAWATILFEDNFDGAILDTSKWNLEPGDGLVLVADGAVGLSCGYGEYPLLITRDVVIPQFGDFSVTVGASFSTPTELGVGVFSVYDGGIDAHVYVWQGWGTGFSGGAGNARVNLSTKPDTSPHVFRWSFFSSGSGDSVALEMDGAFVAGSSGIGRPTTGRLAIGHPHPVFYPIPWTGLAVDFVRVESLQSVSVGPALDKSRCVSLSIPMPQPVRGHCMLAFELPSSTTVDLVLYDLTGRRVRAVIWDETCSSGRHSAALDVQGLSPGVYLARLLTGFGEASQRVVVLGE